MKRIGSSWRVGTEEYWRDAQVLAGAFVRLIELIHDMPVDDRRKTILSNISSGSTYREEGRIWGVTLERVRQLNNHTRRLLHIWIDELLKHQRNHLRKEVRKMDKSKTLRVAFVFEKATKGTYRFQEEGSDQEPRKIGVLYVRKWVFPTGPPKRLEVAVHVG